MCVRACVCMHACMWGLCGGWPERQLNGFWEEAAGQDGHGSGTCFAHSALGIMEHRQESPVGQDQLV